ncbi:MAG: hypothetical protein CMF49_09380 [Legionellales bacterium]|nr:hypothetical protein [Legionellales bacterium]
MAEEDNKYLEKLKTPDREVFFKLKTGDYHRDHFLFIYDFEDNGFEAEAFETVIRSNETLITDEFDIYTLPKQRENKKHLGKSYIKISKDHLVKRASELFSDEYRHERSKTFLDKKGNFLFSQFQETDLPNNDITSEEEVKYDCKDEGGLLTFIRDAAILGVNITIPEKGHIITISAKQANELKRSIDLINKKVFEKTKEAQKDFLDPFGIKYSYDTDKLPESVVFRYIFADKNSADFFINANKDFDENITFKFDEDTNILTATMKKAVFIEHANDFSDDVKKEHKKYIADTLKTGKVNESGDSQYIFKTEQALNKFDLSAAMLGVDVKRSIENQNSLTITLPKADVETLGKKIKPSPTLKPIGDVNNEPSNTPTVHPAEVNLLSEHYLKIIKAYAVKQEWTTSIDKLDDKQKTLPEKIIVNVSVDNDGKRQAGFIIDKEGISFPNDMDDGYKTAAYEAAANLCGEIGYQLVEITAPDNDFGALRQATQAAIKAGLVPVIVGNPKTDYNLNQYVLDSFSPDIIDSYKKNLGKLSDDNRDLQEQVLKDNYFDKTKITTIQDSDDNVERLVQQATEALAKGLLPFIEPSNKATYHLHNIVLANIFQKNPELRSTYDDLEEKYKDQFSKKEKTIYANCSDKKIHLLPTPAKYYGHRYEYRDAQQFAASRPNDVLINDIIFKQPFTFNHKEGKKERFDSLYHFLVVMAERKKQGNNKISSNISAEQLKKYAKKYPAQIFNESAFKRGVRCLLDDPENDYLKQEFLDVREKPDFTYLITHPKSNNTALGAFFSNGILDGENKCGKWLNELREEMLGEKSTPSPSK